MNCGEKRLIEFQNGMTGSFYDALFKAMFKADGMNAGRLLLAYPDEMKAVLDWKNKQDYSVDLFKEYESITKGV